MRDVMGLEPLADRSRAFREDAFRTLQAVADIFDGLRVDGKTVQGI